MVGEGNCTAQQLLTTLHTLTEQQQQQTTTHSQVMKFEIYMSRHSDKENQQHQTQGKRENRVKTEGRALRPLHNNIQAPAQPSIKYQQYLESRRKQQPEGRKLGKKECSKVEKSDPYREKKSLRKGDNQCRMPERPDSYVPIQFRTAQLLQQRQQKIAQRKKEQEVSQLLAQRECTFQPKINSHCKFKNRPKHQHSDTKTEIKSVKGGEEEVTKNPLPIDSKTSPDDPPNSEDGVIETQPTVIFGRYKNASFNVLLDLIK